MTSSESKRRWGRIAWRVVRLPLTAYLIVLLVMSLLENRLVYPAPPASRGDWRVDDDFEDAWVDVPAAGLSREPTRIHGWFFPREGAAWAILYCHGNAEDVSEQRQVGRLLRDRLDAEVLAWDPRGYGKSLGKPNEEGVVADGLAAQRWLAERTGRRPDEVVLVGRSLGGGVATALAAEQGAAALLLQSTFTALPEVGARRYPWLPVRWLMTNRFNSLERITRYDGPVLVSHGTTDGIIPFQQGVALYEAATDIRKRFYEMPGRRHIQPQPLTYYPVAQEFLSGLREN